MLSPAAANCNFALSISQNNLSALFNSDMSDNPINKNASCQPSAAY